MHEPGSKSATTTTTTTAAAAAAARAAAASQQQQSTSKSPYHGSNSSLGPPVGPLPVGHPPANSQMQYYLQQQQQQQHMSLRSNHHNNQPRVNASSGPTHRMLGAGGYPGVHAADQELAMTLLPPHPPHHHPNQHPVHMGIPQQVQQQQQVQCKKNLQKMMGISPSDIDKYSRIFFPVTFTCFNLMYWIIYLHVSDEVAEDLVMLNWTTWTFNPQHHQSILISFWVFF